MPKKTALKSHPTRLYSTLFQLSNCLVIFVLNVVHVVKDQQKENIKFIIYSLSL